MKGKNFSTNNTGKRKESDFYETPYSLTWLLLEHEKIDGLVLEPACGNGAISKWIKCESYDKGRDFLKEKRTFDIVITNPPYSMALDFILKAKKVAKEKIIFLLPLSYLHGKKRYELVWKDRSFPLSKVYIFTRYPLLGEKLREDGKHNTGMMVYAWYVWEKTHHGPPIVKWLDNNSYILSNKNN